MNTEHFSQKSSPERPASSGEARPPERAMGRRSGAAPAAKGLNAESAPIPLDKREILRGRAKALAREPLADSNGKNSLEVVEFRLADERYAIQSTRVREVYPLKELTPLPCTPPFVLGIINVRGQIVTVIDLRRFFDLPIKGITDLNKVIILRADDAQVGVLADAIVGVRSLALEEIQPTLPTLTGVRADYLRGITEERLIILDAGRILADEKIIVHEEVEA